MLVLLFVKYVSDKYAGRDNPPNIVPKGDNFAEMVSPKGQMDIGSQMNKGIYKLVETNEIKLKSVIDLIDFNDKTKLLNEFDYFHKKP